MEKNLNTVAVKPRLGFLSGVSIIIGSVIGSGIFISPKGVLMNTGSVGLCLIVWCICGVLSILLALVYAELGCLMPKSGGDFNYILSVFGTFPAFMFAWCGFLIVPSVCSLLGLTIAEYLTKVILDECGQSLFFKKLLASALVLTAGIINCTSVKLAARTQNMFTVIKLAGVLLIIGGGIITLSQGNVGSLSSGFEDSSTSPSSLALSVYNGMFSYGGWHYLNQIAEELENPKRNLPLCVITAMTVVTLIYLLVNISYFTILSTTDFLSSWAVAVSWAEHVIGSYAFLIPVLVSCSVFGTLVITLLVSGRVHFAAARAGIYPEILSYLNVHSQIPLVPTVLIIILSFVFMFPADIGLIINMLGFVGWIFYGLNMIGFIVLRYRYKDVDRPIKMPIFVPLILLVVIVYLIVAPFLEPVRIEIWYAVGYLVLGVLLYIPFVFFKLSLPGIAKLTDFCQLIFNVAPTTPDETIVEVKGRENLAQKDIK